MKSVLCVAACLLLLVIDLPYRVPVARAVQPTVVAAEVSAQPGQYTGLAFDACSAPSSAAMDAWLASPYRTVGIYFGGINRFCAQPNLTPEWVSHQVANGWHLMPIYLGLQAPCTTSTKKYLIDPAQAGPQGRAEANAAVAAAAQLGLPRASTLIFDMEAYRTDSPNCRTAVLSFLGAWTSRLHDRGYFSGVYSSIASGVTDLVNDYTSTVRPHPDYLSFARYDAKASTDNPAIPAAYWSPHRRIHQYVGSHDETYGGVRINIDNDYVDVAPLPKPVFGDFDGNGWTDLLARDTADQTLYLHAGNGATLEPRVAVRSDWGAYDAFTRFGDFDRDGYEDVIARNTISGRLWLYRGSGTGLGRRVELGAGGWNGMREITAVGDLNGDGYRDLVAVAKSTGLLWLYPGRGTALGPRVRLGPGWNAMSELTGIGDLTGDGRRDMLARQTSTGVLYLYPGAAAGGFQPRISLGAGWSGRRDLVGVGDFNRDGRPDLMAVDTAGNVLYLYPGRSGSFAPRIRISAVWAGRSPLF